MKIQPRRTRRSQLGMAVLLSTLSAVAAVTTTARAEPLHVKDVTLAAPREGAAEVLVATSGAPRFTARVAEEGRRLIVDIEGADVTTAPAALTNGNAVVASVMTQAFEQGGARTTRVLVQLARPASYRLTPEGTGLRITLAAADKTGPAGLRAEPADKPADKTAAKAEAAARAVAAPALTDVRFEHQQGRDRVILELSAPVEFSANGEVNGSGSGRATLELRGARLPDALQRKLDTGAYGGPVRAISTYRRASDPSRVVVEVERDGTTAGVVTREGSALVFTFASGPVPSMVSGVGADGGVARRTHTVAREADLAGLEPRVETTVDAASVTGAAAAKALLPAKAVPDAKAPLAVKEQETLPDQADAFLPTSTLAAQVARRFTGRRIDLDLKDASVHEVLRLLSDVGRVNIVTADNVTGAVTIKMRNVPWDQALETVLQAKGLGMVRQGNMIRVAPLADLNKERELAIARRKSELQLAPIETRIIPVSYAEAKELQARAKDLLSPRGSLAVDDRTNVLIARDVAGNLAQIEELVNTLDTQTPQVLIEARIVEATSNYRRDIGIQWGGDLTFSPATANPTGLAFPASIGVVGGGSDQTTPTGGLSPFTNAVPNPNFAVNLPATVGTGQGGALGLSFGSIANTVNLAVRLSAAEASGMLRIISSPRILTLDNRDARISQGTLIPFSQVSAQGVQTTFQEAKLQLLVKPHVTADGSVAMHVKINRDEPDFNQTSARGDPTILKREAETDLLIMDGHTAVIGGIFTRNTGRNLDQIPVLGDIPILGILFQRRRASDVRSELVIFLTPRIVNRAAALGQ
jgi:type IV pilus assembly protein PilQ